MFFRIKFSTTSFLLKRCAGDSVSSIVFACKRRSRKEVLVVVKVNSKVEQKKEAEAKRKEKQGTVKDSTTSNNFLLLLCFTLCPVRLHNAVQWGAGHQRPRRFLPKEKGVIFPVMPSNSPSIRLMQFERAN